jgi:hypothetical protein
MITGHMKGVEREIEGKTIRERDKNTQQQKNN